MSDTDVQDEPQAEVETTEEKPNGYYPVDTSDLPPEKAKQVEDRINYLYRQVKDNGRMMGEYRSVAQEQSQKIEELMSGVGRVVDHLQNQSTAQTSSDLRAEMKAAFESGDMDGYIAAQDKLLDLKAKALAPKPQAQPKQQPQRQNYSASQIANDGVSDGEITQEDSRLIGEWQNETDERGQPLRPWANNTSVDPNDPDPDFIKAVLISKKVWEANPHRSAAENLAEIDKKMGVTTKGGQTVMGGSLTTRGKTNTIKLTPKQQEIAVKTKFGGPKAKSDADHLEAFRKQLEKVNSKGSR